MRHATLVTFFLRDDSTQRAMIRGTEPPPRQATQRVIVQNLRTVDELASKLSLRKYDKGLPYGGYVAERIERP